jgi:hypothetical protein
MSTKKKQIAPVEEPSNDRIRSVFIDPNLHADVEAFAAANGMSVSEVLREAMNGFSTGSYPVRRRTLKRVTMWIDPNEYVAFTEKVRQSKPKITIREALALALEKML